MAAQREHAAARAADVAEQQLEDRAGADHLHAGGVLRPADRVEERRRALAARVADQRLGHLQELLARDAADLLDHLGRVAREVAPQDLEHAARVLQRLVALDAADHHARARSSPRTPARRARGGRPRDAISPPSYAHVVGS